MAPLDSGRRLYLLFESRAGRFAIEATSVAEVAHPDPTGTSIRGVFELADASILLGSMEDEDRPGMGIVLDTSPTLALRVRRVVEVADLVRAPFFLLPQELSTAMGSAARGAFLHGGRLYLELVPDALLRRPESAGRLPVRRGIPSEHAPERALVFESQKRLFGLPLAMVSQVVAANDAFAPMPAAVGGIAGLFPHAQELWPIYSAPAFLGGAPAREELFVLAELAGRSVGLCATRVLGVHQRFDAQGQPGEFHAAGFAESTLFLDYQQMFS